MSTYVIQTLTGKEELCKKLIEETTTGANLYIPQKTVKRKYEGTWHEERQILFPGYLFVETEDVDNFLSSLPKTFFKTSFKVIGRSEQTILAVSETELDWIRKMTDGDKMLVPISKGIKEGKNVHFTEGPLVGMEGYVKKIDRHKRLVTLEVSLFGREQQFTVGAEILSAAQATEGQNK